jgi:hypothetical protein
MTFPFFDKIVQNVFNFQGFIDKKDPVGLVYPNPGVGAEITVKKVFIIRDHVAKLQQNII